ncbi:SIR2 family protein [Margalitia sp. FSL K6-0131]|uniref:SIR2 family protein n=1 Tax=Margalitia sp. FSL K6-0131 TaxID=2954604 RepID=UPI0030FBF146
MSNSVCLNNLGKSNEYPIIFIGSGISKRYLHSYPKWIELLKEFWDIVEPERNFYAYLNQLKKNLKQKIQNELDLDFITYVEMGSILEDKYNTKFFNSEIKINDFSQEEAFFSNISPFKKAIANRFSHYAIKEEMYDEFLLFQKVLNKSQIILTTNYDNFIEDTFHVFKEKNRLKKFIGQQGFFQKTTDWGEIYKIHGCVEEPSSIIITRDDYTTFDKNSVLISAKIISLLINSPIIFLGYSLSDRNIRKIIRDFSSSLTSKEKEFMKDRIIIINWKEDEEELIEYKKSDDDLDCTYTVIETDNYSFIYKELLMINQGAYPSEVRKFQDLIKELIIDRGKKGALKSLLISPRELDEISERISDENLVVALGDTTYIFKLPDVMTYMQDFLADTKHIHTDIALKFVSIQPPNARIPFFKYLKDVDIEYTSLNAVEKEKLKQRILRFGQVKNSIEKINSSHQKMFDSLEDILAEDYKEFKEMDVIAYNIERLNLDDVECYLKNKLNFYKENGVLTLNSAFRRLSVVLDIMKYK